MPDPKLPQNWQEYGLPEDAWTTGPRGANTPVQVLSQALNDYYDRTGIEPDPGLVKAVQERLPEGYVMAEDFTLVPTSFYDKPAHPQQVQQQAQTQGRVPASFAEAMPKRQEIVKLRIPKLELQLLEQISPEAASFLQKFMR